MPADWCRHNPRWRAILDELDGVQLNGVCLGFGLGFGFSHGVRPQIDGVARLPDRFGEGLLLIEVPPLAALVQLHEMNSTPGAR